MSQIVNPELIKMAHNRLTAFMKPEKRAFVPAGDPSMDPTAAAGGGAPPGGGGPPAGGDPSAGGGAPPPSAPPAPPSPDIGQMVQQAVQAAMAQNAAGGQGGGAEPIKPKIDVNVTLLQLLKMVSRIADSLGVQIPASEMVATQNDLTQFGMQQATGAPGGAPGGAAGAAGGAPSAIQPPAPIQPMAGAMPGGKQAAEAQQAAINNGEQYDGQGLADMGNLAAAIQSAWASASSSGRN